MYSPTRKKGNIAEDVVSQFLKNTGFTILDRNFLRKWGEIDIIASKKKEIHFIEVKSSVINYKFHGKQQTINQKEQWTIKKLCECTSVSCETGVSHETEYFFNPAWNVTPAKQKKLAKTIRAYLCENYCDAFPEFKIDVILVQLDYFLKIAYVDIMEGIVLET